jgi:hypothetical protein
MEKMKRGRDTGGRRAKELCATAAEFEKVDEKNENTRKS